MLDAKQTRPSPVSERVWLRQTTSPSPLSTTAGNGRETQCSSNRIYNTYYIYRSTHIYCTLFHTYVGKKESQREEERNLEDTISSFPPHTHTHTLTSPLSLPPLTHHTPPPTSLLLHHTPPLVQRKRDLIDTDQHTPSKRRRS